MFCGSCLASEKDGAKLLFCASCRTEQYCSKECQLKDWGSHKNRCKGAHRSPGTSTTTTTTVSSHNILKEGKAQLDSTPEVVPHPFREGKLLRNRPCECFDAPLNQYHRRAKARLCFNFVGQCTKPLTECKLVSQLQFSCTVPNTNKNHIVMRRFCSEKCEQQAETSHASRSIIDLDEYRKLVAENVRKHQEKLVLEEGLRP
jgi:hypothetical protein